MTTMLLGVAGLGLILTTTNASASDLSRLLERSRFNVAVGPAVGYQPYYGGYAPQFGGYPPAMGYAPQYGYVPQYGYAPQMGGYGPAPFGGVGYGFPGGYPVGNPGHHYRGDDGFYPGERHCHHHNEFGYGRGF